MSRSIRANTPLVLAVLLWASQATAQTSESSDLSNLRSTCEHDRLCDDHVAQAEEYRAKEQWAGVALEYLAAYERVPYPRFLLNVARAHHKLNQLKQALAYYQRYLEANPPDAPANLAKAREFKAQAEQALQPSDTDSSLRRPESTEQPRPPVLLPSESDMRRPLYKRWWIWTAIGAAVLVAGGITAGVVVAKWPKSPDGVDRFQLEFQ